MGNKLDKAREHDPKSTDGKPVQCIDCGTHYLVPSDLDPEKDPNVIRILAISDTHSKHGRIIPAFEGIPEADILVHGGDFTNVGTLRDIKSYDKWVGDLVRGQKKRFKYAILIAGNHDITLEEDFYTETGYKRFHHGKLQDYKECINIVQNGSSVYLEDESVELLGVSFYGSPYQPEFCDWAFNVPRGKALKKIWAKIPNEGVDVLLTHGPPQYHGDKVGMVHQGNPGQYVGCEELRERMKKVKDVQFHVFGHIHEGYGVTTDPEIDGVTFINASTVNLQYRVTNKPIMFYVKGRGREFCDGDKLKKHGYGGNGKGSEEEKEDEVHQEVNEEVNEEVDGNGTSTSTQHSENAPTLDEEDCPEAPQDNTSQNFEEQNPEQSEDVKPADIADVASK